MDMEVFLASFGWLLWLIVAIIGILLAISPLMTWLNVRELRVEQQERHEMLIKALSSLQKSIERPAATRRVSEPTQTDCPSCGMPIPDEHILRGLRKCPHCGKTFSAA